jgi:hypothetical protein
MSDDAGRQWLTYADLAKALGLPSAKAAEARARRVALLLNVGPGVMLDFGPPAVPQPTVSC